MWPVFILQPRPANHELCVSLETAQKELAFELIKTQLERLIMYQDEKVHVPTLRLVSNSYPWWRNHSNNINYTGWLLILFKTSTAVSYPSFKSNAENANKCIKYSHVIVKYQLYPIGWQMLAHLSNIMIYIHIFEKFFFYI